MTTPALEAIDAAIRNGEITRARMLLREELRERPSADAWYLAARVASTPEQAIEFCRRAIDYDPFHEKASRLLAQVQNLKHLSHPANVSATPQPQLEKAQKLLADAIVIFGNKDWKLVVSTPEMVQFEKQKGINTISAFLLIFLLGLIGSLITIIAIVNEGAERVTLRADTDGNLTAISSKSQYSVSDSITLTNLADSVKTGTRSIAVVVAAGLLTSLCSYMIWFSLLP